MNPTRIGILIFAATNRSRVIATTLAVLCFALPLGMLAFQEVEGFIQRSMYLLIFAWLWVSFPFEIAKGRTLPPPFDAKGRM